MSEADGAPFHYEHGKLRLQKHPRRYWPMESFQQAERALPSWSGLARLELTGPGAVWMYACIGARAGGAGVRTLAIARVDGSKSEFTRETASTSALDHLEFNREGSQVFVRIIAPPESDPIAIAASVAALFRAGDEVVLTGRGSVELYAFIGFAAASAGALAIGCITPPEGMAHIPVFGKGLGERRELDDWTSARLPRGSGVTFGVIGFPNSGKSVLSKLLATALRGQRSCGVAEINAWTFDADPASPTPDWFLKMVGRGEVDAAAEIRKEHKVDWSDELQTAIAERLRRSRPFFDRVIVDLPGGDLRQSPPDLLPKGREQLFEQVDRFIVINKPEIESARQWIETLTRHGLEHRVHAIIDSVHHDQPLAMNVDASASPMRGVAQGLDRTQVEVVESPGTLPKALMKSLRTLVAIDP